MPKELKRLEKELYDIEIGFLKAIKEKSPSQEDLWRKYQNTRRKTIELINYEPTANY